ITGLQPNTTYYFELMAIDQLGNQTPPSNVVSVSTAPVGPTTASSSISISGVTPTTALLSWLPAPGAAFYQIGEATNPNGPFASASVLNQTSNSVTVTGLTPGVTYYFQVTAMDAAGNPILTSMPAAVSTLSSSA